MREIDQLVNLIPLDDGIQTWSSDRRISFSRLLLRHFSERRFFRSAERSVQETVSEWQWREYFSAKHSLSVLVFSQHF